jgi:signal transduction histidine kinase
VTLRSRVSVAAAVLVLIVDAAQQATSDARRIKQAGANGTGTLDFAPVTVGGVQVQLIPGPVAVGRPTRFGPLDNRDAEVARGQQSAYFAYARHAGQQFRVYTAFLPIAPGGGLVRTSQAANADDGALRNAALLLAGLTLGAAAVTYGVARLTAGRILRPIGRLTAAAEHVTQTRDLTARLDRAGSNDEVGRLGASFDTMLAALHESVTAQRRLVADASHELRTACGSARHTPPSPRTCSPAWCTPIPRGPTTPSAT